MSNMVLRDASASKNWNPQDWPFTLDPVCQFCFNWSWRKWEYLEFIISRNDGNTMTRGLCTMQTKKKWSQGCVGLEKGKVPRDKPGSFQMETQFFDWSFRIRGQVSLRTLIQRSGLVIVGTCQRKGIGLEELLGEWSFRLVAMRHPPEAVTFPLISEKLAPITWHELSW